jgi:hypothetical protein
MSARWREPATDPQLDYIKGLTHQLRELLANSGDIAKKLEQAAATTLTKRDASDLIEALKGALAELRGEQLDDNVVPLVSRSKKTETPADVKRRRYLEERDAYDNKQLELHGGEHHREPPEGRGRYMKIWKERPNRSGAYWNPIVYGWSWECAHPSHTDTVHGTRKGVIRGGSQHGYEITVANAQRHWVKYHAEQNDCQLGAANR